MDVGTIALVVSFVENTVSLVDILSDIQDIEYLETAILAGKEDPLREMYDHREQRTQQDEEFGDYVEDLLCRANVDPEVQKQGIQWFQSRMKLATYQKQEQEAARIIGEYAFKLFEQDRRRTDYLLMSSTRQIRVRIFQLVPENENRKTG